MPARALAFSPTLVAALAASLAMAAANAAAAPASGSSPATMAAGAVAAGATPAAPRAAAVVPPPALPPPTTARRAPGTDGGDIVIEAIPASTHPAGGDLGAPAARAAARRAALESPATVQLGDARASDDSVRLVGVKEEGGQTCREYQQTVIVDGTPVQAVSTVCRQRDGTWKLAE
jgi:transcription elongation factor